MSPRQEDYGKDGDRDISLVPDTLRTYRHFAIIDNSFYPMNGGSLTGISPYSLYPPSSGTVLPRTDPGRVATCPCSLCQPMLSEAPRAKTYSGGTFTAECLRHLFGFGLNRLTGRDVPRHSAPSARCQCGFYAHYDPYEDFYADAKWSLDSYTLSKVILVRAVVEMSGKVVMGTRGVRAERMKIIAAATDWGKYQQVFEEEWDISREDFLSVVSTQYLRVQRTGPDPTTRSQVDAQVGEVCYRYRVQHYSDFNVMYKDYPKPDISHLIGSTDDDT